MMTGGAPKSAFELAMEKLKRQDEAAGVAQVQLTAAQREAIAEARRVCEARIAECRILFQSALATTLEPAAREELEANYRRDLARCAADRDKQIARIRNEATGSIGRSATR